MAGKRIKHFIFSRFFPYQRKTFPYDVLDVDFLSKQLPLAKNMLRSLENQTNKNFELVFVANPKYFGNPEYELIFSTLQDFTTIPLRFIKKDEECHLVKYSFSEYDFVVTTRLDFDDFVYKDAVADTQSKIEECHKILLYGYCRGYVYVYNDLYCSFTPCRGIGHNSMFQSYIFESSCAKDWSFIDIYDQHAKLKPILKEKLEKNGVSFSEDMFQQNISTNAWIYFRHEFSQQQLCAHPGEAFKIPKSTPLTTKDVTKKQLEEEFGFTGYELNSIK